MIGWYIDRNNVLRGLDSFREFDTFTIDEDLHDSPLYTSPLNEEYRVVINSFNSSVLVLKNTVFSDWENWPSRLEPKILATLNRLLRAPIKTMFDSYIENRKAFQKERAITFTICPSYSCNMRCAYCFQQNDASIDKKIIWVRLF